MEARTGESLIEPDIKAVAGGVRPATGKIGILTFHRCINYGSYWQARCLAEGVRASGLDAVILEHQSSRINRAEWRCALQPLLPVRTSAQDRPFYERKIRKFFSSFAKLPLSLPFSLEGPAEKFDLILVGSDEVWNLKHPWYGGCPLFFGDGLSGARIASYAASFGSMTSSDVLDGAFAEKLRRFSRISVRDLNSQRLIGKLLGATPEIVLDPCLLFPQVIGAVKAERKFETCAVVYGHSFPEWFQQAVRAWARARQLPLLSIGYRNDWADMHYLDAGPDDFAQAIAGAQAVITNFFHGCVFSLVNGKPFACVLSHYRSNKLRDLAEMLGANRHVVSEATLFAHLGTILDEQPDPAISGRIRNLRHRSKAYLDDVLH